MKPARARRHVPRDAGSPVASIALALVAAALAGCVGASDGELLAGKPCTATGACARGYRCDAATLTCVDAQAHTGGTSAGGALTGGATTGGATTGGATTGGATTGGATTGGATTGGATTGGTGLGDAGAGGQAGAPSGGASTCGNGTVEPGEECEPAEGAPCTEECQVDCSLAVPSASELTLPDGTVHCYFSLIYTRSWADARTQCETFGVHLATIHFAEEHAYVRTLLAPGAPAWIGATDGRSVSDTVAGEYSWITDEPFSFTPPGGFFDDPGFCNGNCAHCAILSSGGPADAWNVAVCSALYLGVCEYTP